MNIVNCRQRSSATTSAPLRRLTSCNLGRPVRSGTRLVAAVAATMWLGAVASGAARRYAITETTTAEAVRLIVLHDEEGGLEAAVAPGQGGELSGLRVRFQGNWIELLHRARNYAPTPDWGGRAPLLWPAVGRNFARGVKPDRTAALYSYDYEERRYEIPIHGFARLKPWRVLASRSDDSQAMVEVALSDDEGTRRQYPFGFEVRVAYRVTQGRLEVSHTVTAASANRAAMPFSIGNHITFRVPFAAGSNLAKFTLESPARIEILKDANTVPTGETRPRDFSDPVSLAGLKAIPPISLGGYAGDPWVRLRDPAGLSLLISHHAQSIPEGPVIQFNLWGIPAEGYFSPEPWVGLHNSLNQGQGLIRLRAGESWSWVVRVCPETASR